MPMNSTAQKIQATIQKVRELEKVEKHLNKLQQQMDLANAQKAKLISRVNAEEADVKKLESLSLKGLFYKVLGSKEEQIEKERQEYLQAFMELEDHNKEIELIAFEQNVLQEKRINLTGLRAQLKQLLTLREKELRSSGAPAGKRLLEIETQTGQANALIWEIGEAVNEGHAATVILEQMIHFLKGARNWGHWGSNRNPNWQRYQRRSNIDKARERAHFAKQQLLKFQRELQDLYPNPSNYAEALQVDLYQGFMASLFNNLMSDWVLQQKIKNSINMVLNVKDQVVMEMNALIQNKQSQENKMTLLENEKKSILLTK